MGIKTVAVYSEADKNSLHAALADECVCVGGPSASSSYLNQENIISAALATGARAIHPGYGFLAENASFARLCEASGIVFIGPDGDTIEKMGNKNNARELMIKAGVPVIPGSGAPFRRCGSQGFCRKHRISRADKSISGRRRKRDPSRRK